jgi:hypothetical protein
MRFAHRLPDDGAGPPARAATIEFVRQRSIKSRRIVIEVPQICQSAAGRKLGRVD